MSRFGSVDQLPSGRWRVRVMLGGQRRSLGTFRTEQEARDMCEAVLGELQCDRAHTGFADTLRVHGDKVLQARQLDGVRDWRGERRRWRRYVLTWNLIDASMRSITPGDVYDLVAAIARDTSRATSQRCLSLLRAVFDDAVRRGMIDRNPARGIRLPGRPGRIEDPWTYLTPQEQHDLLTATTIPQADRVLIAIALGTGIRQSEQAGTLLQDVHVNSDEPNPHMMVRRSGTGPTKSGRPRRIRLFGLGLVAVRAWLELLGDYAPNNPRGLLCPTPSGAMRCQGHPLGSMYVQCDSKTRHVDRWGYLQQQVGLRRVRWHDLRHTFATACIAGWWGKPWSLERICHYLGHSSIVTTERYAHLSALADESSVVTNWPCVVTTSTGHDHKRACARNDEIPLFSWVGQPGLEPGTDGLKVRSSTD